MTPADTLDRPGIECLTDHELIRKYRLESAKGWKASKEQFKRLQAELDRRTHLTVKQKEEATP